MTLNTANFIPNRNWKWFSRNCWSYICLKENERSTISELQIHLSCFVANVMIFSQKIHYLLIFKKLLKLHLLKRMNDQHFANSFILLLYYFVANGINFSQQMSLFSCVKNEEKLISEKTDKWIWSKRYIEVMSRRSSVCDTKKHFFANPWKSKKIIHYLLLEQLLMFLCKLERKGFSFLWQFSVWKSNKLKGRRNLW